jgi:hypothetical protein
MDEQLTHDANKTRTAGRHGSEDGNAAATSRAENGRDNGTGAQTMEQQPRSVADTLTEQARSVASGAGSTASDIARRARDGAAAAGDAVYQQGSQAGQYLARSMEEYPITALLVAGAIGYGLAYLIHSRSEEGGPIR